MQIAKKIIILIITSVVSIFMSAPLIFAVSIGVPGDTNSIYFYQWIGMILLCLSFSVFILLGLISLVRKSWNKYFYRLCGLSIVSSLVCLMVFSLIIDMGEG